MENERETTYNSVPISCSVSCHFDSPSMGGTTLLPGVSNCSKETIWTCLVPSVRHSAQRVADAKLCVPYLDCAKLGCGHTAVFAFLCTCNLNPCLSLLQGVQTAAHMLYRPFVTSRFSLGSYRIIERRPTVLYLIMHRYTPVSGLGMCYQRFAW